MRLWWRKFRRRACCMRNVRILIGLTLALLTVYSFPLVSNKHLLLRQYQQTNEIDLFGSDRLQSSCVPRTRFVYVKMIKCASTTLANVFRRFGLEHNLTFVLPPKNKIYIGWPYTLDDTFYRPLKPGMTQYDILCDHVVYDAKYMDQLMGPHTAYIASIREPFSQFKSMVNYYNVLNISRVPLDVPDRFVEYVNHLDEYEAIYKSPSAREKRYCIPDGFSMTKNLMSFNLGFPTGGFRSKDEDLMKNQSLIHEWISSLDEKFSLVLISEYFVESIVLLRRLMCWRLNDILFHSSNSLTYNYRTHVDGKLVDKYRQWSPVDYKLYSYFNQTLWKKIQKQGPDFWDEVKQFKQINEQVGKFCEENKENQHKSKQTVIQRTTWNEEFVISSSFCATLMTDLLTTLHADYDRQFPTDFEEKQPAKVTC